MNIEKKVDVKLTVKELKEIVAEYLTSHGIKASPEDVSFDTSIKLEGFGANEYETAVLNGCRVVSKED